MKKEREFGVRESERERENKFVNLRRHIEFFFKNKLHTNSIEKAKKKKKKKTTNNYNNHRSALAM